MALVSVGQAIYAAARDVTERKQGELALDEARRMLRLILDTIPVRVFWKDTQGRYLGWVASSGRTSTCASTSAPICGRSGWTLRRLTRS